MSMFRQSTQRLLGLDEAPATLWVHHSPATRLLCEDADGPHLQLEGHFDWILAAGKDELGLFRVRGPRLTTDDLMFRSPYGPLEIDVVDTGDLALARVFTVSATPGPWFAVSAPIHGRRRSAVDEFTDLVRGRCDAVPIG